MRRAAAIAGLALASAALFGCAYAETEIDLKAVEARVGWIDPEAPVPGTLGLSATGDLGTLTRDVGLEVGIDLWAKSRRKVTWTNVAFLGTARYDFRLESSFHPFVFGGLGFHVVSRSVDDPGNLKAEDNTTDLNFGVHLGAGGDVALTDKTVLTRRFGYNINGKLDYLFLQAGVKFVLGRSARSEAV